MELVSIFPNSLLIVRTNIVRLRFDGKFLLVRTSKQAFKVIHRLEMLSISDWAVQRNHCWRSHIFTCFICVRLKMEFISIEMLVPRNSMSYSTDTHRNWMQKTKHDLRFKNRKLHHKHSNQTSCEIPFLMLCLLFVKNCWGKINSLCSKEKQQKKSTATIMHSMVEMEWIVVARNCSLVFKFRLYNA